jgi:hypothetical protein
MNFDSKVIERISNLKYPDCISLYDITEVAAYKIIKKYKRDLKLEDIIDIIQTDKNKNGVRISIVLNIIKNTFNESKFRITDEYIDALSWMQRDEFIKFTNSIADSDEIFIGNDIKWYYTTIDLKNSRSYKIYKIINE